MYSGSKLLQQKLAPSRKDILEAAQQKARRSLAHKSQGPPGAHRGGQTGTAAPGTGARWGKGTRELLPSVLSQCMVLSAAGFKCIQEPSPLEKEMAVHCSILAWKIPWTGAWRATVHGVSKSWTWLSTNMYELLSTVSNHSCLTCLYITDQIRFLKHKRQGRVLMWEFSKSVTSEFPKLFYLVC